MPPWSLCRVQGDSGLNFGPKNDYTDYGFQNFIQEEINRRFNSNNACYHSVQNLLPSRLLSKYVKSRKYTNIIWPIVLYECGIWLLISREEYRMRVFENRVLRRIFETKRDEVVGGSRKTA
jgi:hypothetical protein